MAKKKAPYVPPSAEALAQRKEMGITQTPPPAKGAKPKKQPIKKK